MRRRAFLVEAAAVAAGATALGRVAAQEAGAAAPPEAPRVIGIVARRFRYEPAEIPLRVGERVIIEVRSLDFVHGMNLPDLHQRHDLVPGTVTRFELHPDAPGPIDFVCDNFCGDGHEGMHGRFVVTA